MIAKIEMFPLVLEVCPSFLATWELLQHDRNGSSDDALHDRALEALCRHVTRMLRHADADGASAPLALAERLLVEGGPDVRRSVRSLIETLQNQTRDTANAHQFRQLLGTRCAEHWDDFERFLQANQMISRWEESRTGPIPQLDLESIKDQELRDLLQRLCEGLRPE
jgi:hypothetical protein